MSTSRFFKLALLLALVLTACWYILGFSYSYEPPFSEPDSLVYLTYARNMAEGAPFQFTPGDDPTTGCTSYLYPILLSALYKMGCTGSYLITASFWLNGLFYMGYVVLVGLIARKLAPRFYPIALFAAVLSGQALYTFFGQTDMGLLMVLVLFCFWAFISDRKIWLVIGTLLAGLTHPTALAPAGGLIATGLLFVFLRKGTLHQRLNFTNIWPLWIGCAGVAAVAATFAFNWLLTGDFIFMSLRSKRLFEIYSFPAALTKTIIHSIWLIKGVFFSLGDGTYRAMFFFPLLTGLAACGGLLLRPWQQPKKVRFDFFILLTVAAEIVLLSTSDRQALSHDRYMAWVIPLLFIYAAVFLEKIRNVPVLSHATTALATLLLLFQTASLTFFTATFVQTCDHNAVAQRFVSDELTQYTQPGDRIAMEGASALMWFLPDRAVFHPFGIFSTEGARGSHWLGYVETLKYQPERRADYWLLTEQEFETNPSYKFFTGDQIVADTDALSQGWGFSLYGADWSALDPVAPGVQPRWKPCNRLDIGYYEDEKRTGYQAHTRLRGVITSPVVDRDPAAGLVEVGQLVLGHETFRLSDIMPDKALHVVLRTGRKTRVYISHYQTQDILEYRFASPIKLTVSVDGQDIELVKELEETGFSDIAFTIPAEMILSGSPEITVGGDHLSYGYWFYQSPDR